MQATSHLIPEPVVKLIFRVQTMISALFFKSSMADLAFGNLMLAAKEEGGMVYWGRSDISTNRFAVPTRE